MTLELEHRLPGEAHQQALRAWVVIAAASGVALVLLLLIGIGGRWAYVHASKPETGTLTVISGSGALWRPDQQAEWTLITSERSIGEGDQLSTALGTVLWITLFDGSTVEVAEDTVVTFARMRSSRFTKTTKHFVIEPERGMVYAALAPHGAYEYSEMTIRSDTVTLTMSDEPRRNDAGAMLFEVAPRLNDSDDPSYRAAVLRGRAVLTSAGRNEQLIANEQVTINSVGVLSAKTRAVREFVRNGHFEEGLSGWTEFHDSAGVNAATRSGQVELVDDSINGVSIRVVELRRDPPSEPMAQAGIRQSIGKTLRVYSGLQLSVDVRIDLQDPAGAGQQGRDFPLTIVLQYVDTQGEERLWSRGYFVGVDPAAPVPHALATQLRVGVWEHIVFDLRNLAPLPRQIGSIVLYASGNGYRTRLANISLTSSELSEPGQ
jgi:hypothetical protein